MKLDKLRLKNLRLIEEAEIEPERGINLIVGKNGAGKTTVLESIYLLGRGRTFKGPRHGALVSKGKNEMVAYGRFCAPDGIQRGIGLKLEGQRIQIRINQEDVKKISELAELVPLQVYTEKTREIINGEPAIRRRWLDWGVFHVEQGYRDLYEDFRRANRQRNILLRNRDPSVWIWDRKLAELGEQIDKKRGDYIEGLVAATAKNRESFPAVPEVRIDYERGWKKGESLLGILERTRQKDFDRGYTSFGPHRAEVLFTGENGNIASTASSGQKKLFLISLLIAAADLMAEKRGLLPIILIDDFTAELDRENQQLVLKYIEQKPYQFFLTSTEVDRDRPGKPAPMRLFHVEQGRVRRSDSQP